MKDDVENMKQKIKLFLIFFLISLASSMVIAILNYAGLSESLTSILSDGVGILISGLLYFGYYSFFLKVSRNEEVTWQELFARTDLFLPYIAISFLVGFFTFLWTLLLMIPGIIAVLNYSMVYYVALDNPELGAMDVIRKSKELMNGHKMELFILQLSFIGWGIVGIFTLGILYFWLVPYMQVTMANFYNEIKKGA